MTENKMKNGINQQITSQISQINEKCKRIKPLVVIQCITYNHGPYIRDALDGFVMQKTDFPFVAIVHDDASTDNTAEIICEYAQKYPDIILPILEKENQYSKTDGSLGRILRNAKEATGAKYIALCEGDDYWTDPHKLQIQVDFLESNPEYSMVVTNYKRYYQKNNKFENITLPQKINLIQLLSGNILCTPTVVIRHSVLAQFYNSGILSEIKNLKMGDYPIWLWCAWKYKIYCLKENTTIYRVLSGSASHGDYNNWLKFMISASEIKLYFSKRTNILYSSILLENSILKTVLYLTENDMSKVKLEQKKTQNIDKSNLNFKLRFLIFLNTYSPYTVVRLLQLRYKQEKQPSLIYKAIRNFRRYFNT